MTTALPASLYPLLTRTPLPSLRPTSPYDASLQHTISTLPHPPCVLGILHLLNDDLVSAHEVVQNDEGNASSDYIHSILHRREADYWNSKWWLGQFRHPVVPSLYEAEDYEEATRRAKRFVDEVEGLVGGGAGKGATTACGATRKMEQLKKVQWREMRALAEYVLKECGVGFDQARALAAA
ncbi:hypothetical protein ACQY0O_003529 [Thecaphora frezii]